MLRLADSKRCRSYRWDDVGMLVTEGFDFKDRNLKQSWKNEKIVFSREGVVKDIDGDGEEEMIFMEYDRTSPRPMQRLVRLSGIKDFLPYTPFKTQ